jgi:phosphatidylglycerol lysyltransferase
MASNEDFAAAVEEFRDHCVRHGWTPSLYLACEERMATYHSLGFASQRAADEAIIDLTSWTAPMPAVDVRRYDRSQGVDLVIDEQLEEVTEDWLQTRHMGEMSFTIGRFSLESLSDGPVFILQKANRAEAFCAWLPYANGSAMVLDLLRQRHTAAPNTAEMLVAASLRLLADSGIREASLSAIESNATDVMNPLDREFMSRFCPQWLPRYIVYPRGAALSRINYALSAIRGQAHKSPKFGRSAH